jgi:hypothetical protein
MYVQRIATIFKSTALGLLIVLQVGLYPVAAMAQSVDESTPEQAVVESVDTSSDESTESTPETSETTPTENTSSPTLSIEPTTPTTGPTQPTGPQEPTGPQQTTGPTQPTGAAATTYTQNEDGTWENDLYIWDPVTHQTRPKEAQDYSFNPTTGMWDTKEWYYAPESGKYVANTISVSQNPLALASSPQADQGSITVTGSGSNNTIDFGGTTTGTFDLFFDASVSNAIGQMSRSGDASIQGNTRAGNALTGDAQSIANILNLLQSSWGDLGSDDISTFVANVDGDVVGDLFIDPSQLASGSGSTDLDINVEHDASIHNDIDVAAVSGDASVSGNTKVGDATTGNARAVVNLLNLINSAINADKSFIGVLNINGNLEGDILLPPGMLEAIIARTGPTSNNQISDQNSTSLSLSVDDNKTINNTVTTDSVSGDASASGNTLAGTVSTGRADSNITLLNLTGKRVVAKNAILVFVNVFGKWVGLIMNAPAGSYAVAATGAGSNNTINADSDTNVDIDVAKDSEITNTVRATARSGDANASDNTQVGDVRSGDTDASVNIVNMIDSEFELDDWFGVLFINVYGSWHGSFGVDTPYGNKRALSTGTGSEGPLKRSVTPMGTPGNVFSFMPALPSQASPASSPPTANSGGSTGQSANQNTGSSVQTPATTPAGTGAQVAAALAQKANLWPPIIAGAGALMLLFGEQFLAFVRRVRP